MVSLMAKWVKEFLCRFGPRMAYEPRLLVSHPQGGICQIVSFPFNRGGFRYSRSSTTLSMKEISVREVVRYLE